MSYEEKPIEYSPGWKGPLKERSCTDCLCLVIFLIFMGCWLGIGTYALTNGDLKTFLAPVDSQGRKCGVDDEVVDKPNLIFFDLTKCINTDRNCDTPQICRKECPSSNWFWEPWDQQSLNYIRDNIICEDSVDVYTKDKADLRALILQNKCTKWYLKSASILGRCMPNTFPIDLINIGISIAELKQAEQIVKAIIWWESVVDALLSNRNTILGFIAGSAGVCLIYIFLLRWLAFPLVFIAIALITACVSYLSYYFYELYVAENTTATLVLTILFAIIAGLIVLIALCLLKRIRLACQLIKEASKAVGSIVSSLFFPIIPWLMHLSAIVYLIVIGTYLYSIHLPEIWQTRLLFSIHVIGFIWFYFFVTAVGEMILAATFATWYWTFNKSDVPFFTLSEGAWRTLRYHLGTAAFGSLLLTICRVIRISLEVLRYFMKNQDCLSNNVIGRWCISCTQILMGFVEKFIKFMNRNAYIVCAVYGKGLCSSASDALSLLLRNALRVIVLNNIVSWLLWLGKIGITLSMVAFTSFEKRRGYSFDSKQSSSYTIGRSRILFRSVPRFFFSSTAFHPSTSYHLFLLLSHPFLPTLLPSVETSDTFSSNPPPAWFSRSESSECTT